MTNNKKINKTTSLIRIISVAVIAAVIIVAMMVSTIYCMLLVLRYGAGPEFSAWRGGLAILGAFASFIIAGLVSEVFPILWESFKKVTKRRGTR